MTNETKALLEPIKHASLTGPDGLQGAKTPAEFLRDDAADYFVSNRAGIGELDMTVAADRATLEKGYKDSLEKANVRKALCETKNKQTGKPAMSEDSWKKYLRRSLDYLLALAAGKVRKSKDATEYTVAHHVGADHGRVLRGLYPAFRKATKAEREANEKIEQAHQAKYPPAPADDAQDAGTQDDAQDAGTTPESSTPESTTPDGATDATGAGIAAHKADVSQAASAAYAQALTIAERNLGADATRADLQAGMKAIYDLLLPHVARPSVAA